MPEILLNLRNRQLLQAIRELATQETAQPGMSENWIMAFLDIAKAMDYLDAMIARGQVEQGSIIKPATLQPVKN